jgi:hypothetical protein
MAKEGGREKEEKKRRGGREKEEKKRRGGREKEEGRRYQFCECKHFY